MEGRVTDLEVYRAQTERRIMELEKKNEILIKIIGGIQNILRNPTTCDACNSLFDGLSGYNVFFLDGTTWKCCNFKEVEKIKAEDIFGYKARSWVK